MKKLTQEEIQRLRSAMERLIKEKGMEHLGSMHGGPKKDKGRSYCPDHGDICCLHTYPGFLPWHRLYMTQMEDALGMALPYWDWTEEDQGPGSKSGIPSLWEGLTPTLRDGVDGACTIKELKDVCACTNEDPMLVSRQKNVSIDAKSKRGSIQVAFDQPDFDRFEPLIRVPHDRAHGEIGCEMGAHETAGYDPMFFLHHTFVDYQWAFWQEVHRIREALL